MDTWDQIDEVIRGAVLYSDGSCRGNSNPGYIGWGIHGYLFTNTEIPKPLVVSNHTVTNKGYSVNRADPLALPIDPMFYIDAYGSSLDIGSNNLAEMLATLNSLKIIKEHKVTIANILTDSEYVVKGLNDWCKHWIKNGWRRKDGTIISNKDVWIELYDLLLTLRDSGKVINISWVKGHENVLGNVQADILAGIAANHSIDKVFKVYNSMMPAKAYWATKSFRHPFLNIRNVYFNTSNEFNTPGEYFQADLGSSNLILGKRHSETSLSFIKLREPNEAIEIVKQSQYSGSECNAIMMINLDFVFSKAVYRTILEHGKYCFNKTVRNFNLLYTDKSPVTLEVNPVGLALRAIDSFNILEEILNSYISQKTLNQPTMNLITGFHDITDVLYTKGTKTVKKEEVPTCVLKDSINSKLDKIIVPVTVKDQVIPIPLLFGLDILVRDALKKLETENPSVYIVTWMESNKTVRYSTIIDCESGYGIWSNFYSNYVFEK